MALFGSEKFRQAAELVWSLFRLIALLIAAGVVFILLDFLARLSNH